MKKVILNSYFDKGLGRTVEAGEILDIDQDRIEVLASIGVNVKECDDDLDDESKIMMIQKKSNLSQITKTIEI